ncbi:MAG: hypothetical protein V1495_01530 [Pseudomonadota bacterium]
MRGTQIAEALSRRGFTAEVRFGSSRSALCDLHDSVVVCIKSRPFFTGWLRRQRNRIVYDAADYTPLRGLPTGAAAIITGNEDMARRIRRRVGPAVIVQTIYHHADPGLKPHTVGERELRLVYIGETESSRFLRGEVPELTWVRFGKVREWREELRKYNAHFSARLDRNKSVVKLANVAALGAVFLTGAEPGCVELLGPDYPFYLRNPRNLTVVREDVVRLKEAVGTESWKEARRRIEAVRPRLTIEASAAAYEELLASVF